VTIGVWAWSEGVQNFGDELGPEILKRAGLDIERVDSIQEADLVSCGSLLEYAAVEAKPGCAVWGSGLMHGQPVDVSGLEILAVRGEITATALNQYSVPTGDPGSLVPMFWSKPEPKYDIGVVRHYVDDREYPWADVVIDAGCPVDEVIELIGSCRRIASSSLHGLVVAESWGIPTMRLHHPAVAGNDFKWADWFVGGHQPDQLLEALFRWADREETDHDRDGL
jgi:pyruvyltransferase